MPLSEVEVYLAARAMIDVYGNEARSEVSTRARKARAQGADRNAMVWWRIRGAVDVLRRTKRVGAEALN